MTIMDTEEQVRQSLMRRYNHLEKSPRNIEEAAEQREELHRHLADELRAASGKNHTAQTCSVCFVTFVPDGENACPVCGATTLYEVPLSIDLSEVASEQELLRPLRRLASQDRKNAWKRALYLHTVYATRVYRLFYRSWTEFVQSVEVGVDVRQTENLVRLVGCGFREPDFMTHGTTKLIDAVRIIPDDAKLRSSMLEQASENGWGTREFRAQMEARVGAARLMEDGITVADVSSVATESNGEVQEDHLDDSSATNRSSVEDIFRDDSLGLVQLSITVPRRGLRLQNRSVLTNKTTPNYVMGEVYWELPAGEYGVLRIEEHVSDRGVVGLYLFPIAFAEEERVDSDSHIDAALDTLRRADEIEAEVKQLRRIAAEHAKLQTRCESLERKNERLEKRLGSVKKQRRPASKKLV